jgi:hypothetical protein
MLGLGGGAAIYWALGSRTPPASHAPSALVTAEAPAAALQAPQIVLNPTMARIGEEDRAALRDVIRQELHARPAPAASSDSTPDPAPDPSARYDQLSPTQRTAYDEARSVVDDRVRRRTWTEDDRQQLRASVGDLPAEVRAALLAPLIRAVNSGEVRFEGRGPLL